MDVVYERRCGLDIHKQTVDAMPATLDALIAKGYKFVTVSQLIAMNKPKPPPADESARLAKNRKGGTTPAQTETSPTGKTENASGGSATPTPAGGSQ